MSELAKPRHPYLILAAAVLLPSSGHVLQGRQQRGLIFLFFIVILAWATSKIAPADASFLGRHAGGVFIYGLSILDAYKTARVRWEIWKHQQTSG
jgi:hypothetical protein